MNRLFYINFDFDVRFCGQISLKLSRALSEATTYSLLFGDKSDHVLLDCRPADDYFDFLSRTGINPPVSHVEERDIPPGLTACPWGWNDDALALFERVGASSVHPPLDVVERINARDFSERLGRETGLGVPGSKMCLDANDVWTFCRQTTHGKFVLKPRHGNAGHGFIHGSAGAPSERFQRRVNTYFQRVERPGLSAEPWFERIIDFSSKFYIDHRGDIHGPRIYQTLTTTAGTFRGILLNNDLKWLDTSRERVQKTMLTVAQALAKEGYYGICGIDSMIVRNENGQNHCIPLVEINARETFSVIAHALQKNLAPDRVCLLSVISGKHFRLPVDYMTVHRQLGPLSYDARKRTGALVVSPLLFHRGNKTWLPERFLLFIAAHSEEECLELDRGYYRTFRLTGPDQKKVPSYLGDHEKRPVSNSYGHHAVFQASDALPDPGRKFDQSPRNNTHKETQSMTMGHSPNLIVICGPTATGKTRLGVDLALRIGGEIISADSRQVYRGMDIGTGKDIGEYSRPEGTVPCHLIDIAEPSYHYSIHDYQRDFYRVFSEIRERRRVPILVGGSGLYIEAILRDFTLSDVPEVADFRRASMMRSKDELLWELAQKAPDLLERTDCTSVKRIVRAIEIATFSGTGPSNRVVHRPNMTPIVVCIAPPRMVLHQRIQMRLSDRLNQGLVEEVRRLSESGISAKRFEMLGMEYRFVARYLAGILDYDTMVEQLERAIRKLAKRQLTWFRGMERRGVQLHWLEGASLEATLNILDGSRRQ